MEDQAAPSRFDELFPTFDDWWRRVLAVAAEENMPVNEKNPKAYEAAYLGKLMPEVVVLGGW